MPMMDIGSLSQEQTVVVEKDPFNIVPQDYIINCQWKLKTVKTYLFGESYDMSQKTINEQYKV